MYMGDRPRLRLYKCKQYLRVIELPCASLCVATATILTVITDIGENYTE